MYFYCQIKLDKSIKKNYNRERRNAMKYITYQQYKKYLKNKNIMSLKEEEVVYHIAEDKVYCENIVKEIDKKHDKMFRKILSRKNEMVNFLNGFLDLEEKIEETQIIPCPTDFITKFYQSRQSDILYRLKDKPVYYLIEHQSTMDQEMLLRIWDYVGEIIKKETIKQNTNSKKDSIYPIVIPIVIYTGFQKWNLPTNFAEKQYESKKYKKHAINLAYNLIQENMYILGLDYNFFIDKQRTINKLVRLRNSVAHGSQRDPIEFIEYEKLEKKIFEIMEDLIKYLFEFCLEERYFR